MISIHYKSYDSNVTKMS